MLDTLYIIFFSTRRDNNIYIYIYIYIYACDSLKDGQIFLHVAEAELLLLGGRHGNVYMAVIDIVLLHVSSQAHATLMEEG